MATYIPSELKKVYVEDVQNGASVSESVQSKMGATINYIADNAVFSHTESMPNAQIFTSSGSFVVPTGITRVKVTCLGGGAGGVSNPSNTSGDKAGGGGGGMAIKWVTVTPAASISVVVASSASYDVNGGTSSFGTSCYGYGGTSGGAGGSGVGDVVVNGGSSAGNIGNNVSVGGDSALGFGGKSYSANGQNYGGGGAGAQGDTATYGGTGGQGLVIVEWNKP